MVFAGAFLTGAIFSTVVGIVILPLSLLGLVVLLGIFGFTPFVTAFVFLRTGVRAARININGAAWLSRLSAAAFGAALVLATPLAVHAKVESDVSSLIHTIISGSAPEAEAAAQRLKTYRFVSRDHYNAIVAAYYKESNTTKRAMLERTYREITGEELEWRHRSALLD
mgnify:CR=1 FL=1